MNINKLSDTVSVCPQISAGDLPAIKQAGFRSIICNRPDGEGVGQPSHAELAAAAEALGLELRYLPVVAGQLNAGDGQAFGALLKELSGPVLAYCRSGARSANLWSMAQAGPVSG